MIFGAAAAGVIARRKEEMRKKLERVGANSKETAVTIEEAGFDEIEKKWLCLVKKTVDEKGKDRYYVEPRKGIYWW